MKKTIAIGSDHAGFACKQKVLEFLQQDGYEIEDFGTHSEESVDYPDYVHPIAKRIYSSPEIRGIIICGSGQGVSITANKYAHIRAALAWMPEIAAIARKHNDANVLCIPGRYISIEMSIDCVRAFLETEFEGGRHQLRISKIPI